MALVFFLLEFASWSSRTCEAYGGWATHNEVQSSVA